MQASELCSHPPRFSTILTFVKKEMLYRRKTDQNLPEKCRDIPVISLFNSVYFDENDELSIESVHPVLLAGRFLRENLP